MWRSTPRRSATTSRTVTQSLAVDLTAPAAPTDTADANTASVTVKVADNAGNTDTVNLTFPAVAKGDQAFSRFVYNATPVTFGLPPPRLLVPTGPKTAVSYSASPSTVCTVDSSTGELTIVSVGDCVVTATAAGTANYNQATVTVTPGVTGSPDVTFELARLQRRPGRVG